MNIQDKISHIKISNSYSIPAKRLMEHLEPIIKNHEDLQQRWGWELLQNASDLGNNICAKFEITDNHLKFSHNGKPFTLQEAWSLITPDSTKDEEDVEDEDIIGKFGTGFISTHVLSKVIDIEGIIMQDELLYRFNYQLDRSDRSSKSYLIDSIIKTEESFKSNIRKLKTGQTEDYQTIFTYHTDNVYDPLNGKDIVNEGVKSLKDLVPLVLAFRPQIQKIEIIDRRDETVCHRYERKVLDTNINELSIIKTSYFKNSIWEKDIIIGVLAQDEVDIALPLKELSEKDKFKILSYPKNSPRLFCAFPMIGTSNFNFPVVINSLKFEPDRERDGINFAYNGSLNRDRIIEATEAYIKLLDIIQEYDWLDAFNICQLKPINIENPREEKWFKEKIFNILVENIYSAALVELDNSLKLNSKRTSLKLAYIPDMGDTNTNQNNINKTLHDFCFRIIPDQIPKKDHLSKWNQVIDPKVFRRVKLDLYDLARIMKNSTDLDGFSEKYKLPKDEAIKYSINLISFIIEQDESELLEDFDLILNQNNEFVCIKDLKIDCIEYKGLETSYIEKLKDIYKSLCDRDDCRNILLHQDFKIIEPLIASDQVYDLKTLSRNIDNNLKDTEYDFHKDNLLKTLKDLFVWHANCGIDGETLKKLFPYFTDNMSQLYLNTKTPAELEYAFDIEISGKSKVLAKIAKSKIPESVLELIANNPEIISNIDNWINRKVIDNPDKQLGDIGERILYDRLCDIFGKERVKWDDKPEYDFRVLEEDLKEVKYYIDAKTTNKGIANSDSVPFYMRTSQWLFLENKHVVDKYIIARIFKNGDEINIEYLMLNKHLIIE